MALCSGPVAAEPFCANFFGGTQALALTAALATFSLSGQIAKQFQLRVASQGTYILTGVSQILTKAWKALSVTAGSYILTGVAQNFVYGHVLTAAKGIFVLSGQIAKQLQLRVALGSAFILTGVSANLFKSQNFVCGAGTFVLTGITIVFARLAAAAGFDRIRVVNSVLQKIRIISPQLEE